MSPIAYTGLEYERRFELFGSQVRLLIGEPTRDDLPSPEVIGMQLEAFLRLLHARLTRFDPGSELCALNDAPVGAPAAGSMLLAAVEAGLWAARRSNGLVDPTLLPELERAGYSGSRKDSEPASITAAIAAAPPRRPARPRPAAGWRHIEVDSGGGVVRRPPGIRIDTGGTGKGLAADLASERLEGYATHVVDAGGDLRLGGERPPVRVVRIEHPLHEGPAHQFVLDRGAIATSGISTRIWKTADGFAHHLLDPSTGLPAWTGVIQATALGSTALEAETLAKMAFLSGPAGALPVLAERGGVVVLDDGSVRLIGPLARDAADATELAA